MHMRIPVARLRASTHPLRIETGRYNLPMPIPAEECYCWFCQYSLVEDECYFLFECNLYNTLQEKSKLMNSIAHSSTLSSHIWITWTNGDSFPQQLIAIHFFLVNMCHVLSNTVEIFLYHLCNNYITLLCDKWASWPLWSLLSIRVKAGSQYDAKQCVALRHLHIDACRNARWR